MLKLFKRNPKNYILNRAICIDLCESTQKQLCNHIKKAIAIENGLKAKLPLISRLHSSARANGRL